MEGKLFCPQLQAIITWTVWPQVCLTNLPISVILQLLLYIFILIIRMLISCIVKVLYYAVLFDEKQLYSYQ